VADLPEGVDYRFKYADRSFIEELFNLRRESDDILMTRQGWITDTSMANIAFRGIQRWFTPSLPLLAGTTWKRLVYTGRLIPRPIHVRELPQFEYYRVFNAMNDFETAPEYSIENISYHG
jgi:4-amino-4-deoxychorismate lyase